MPTHTELFYLVLLIIFTQGFDIVLTAMEAWGRGKPQNRRPTLRSRPETKVHGLSPKKKWAEVR
jgi:hypothetical protein